MVQPARPASARRHAGRPRAVPRTARVSPPHFDGSSSCPGLYCSRVHQVVLLLASRAIDPIHRGARGRCGARSWETWPFRKASATASCIRTSWMRRSGSSSSRSEASRAFTAPTERCRTISSPGGPPATPSKCLGIVAFRASPVWVLAALADLCGMGRHLIPEVADALKAQHLLEEGAEFTTIDQTAGRPGAAPRPAQRATINTPPLDVAGLREEWDAIREEARGLPRASLPSRETISTHVGAAEGGSRDGRNRSVFETSSAMAVSAARPSGGVRWLSASARVGATRTGHIFAAALLDHYGQTLSEIQQVGYLAYAPAGSFARISARPRISSRRNDTRSRNTCSRSFNPSDQRGGNDGARRPTCCRSTA